MTFITWSQSACFRTLTPWLLLRSPAVVMKLYLYTLCLYSQCLYTLCLYSLCLYHIKWIILSRSRFAIICNLSSVDKPDQPIFPQILSFINSFVVFLGYILFKKTNIFLIVDKWLHFYQLMELLYQTYPCIQ